MKFKTEAERLQHPLAGKIPTSIWNDTDIFNNEITDQQLLLLDTSLESLLNPQNGFLDGVKNQKNVQFLCTAYICILLANSEAPAIQMQEAAKSINIGIDDVYIHAASGGHLAILQRLEDISSDVQRLIAEAGDVAYRLAAGHGHLEILEHLEEIAADHIQEMIEADQYAAYRKAAAGGYLRILEHLEEIAPDRIQEMIGAVQYEAFHDVVRNVRYYDKHHDVLQHLLGISYCFAYAEMHEEEYSEYVHPFVAEQLINLRNQREDFEAANSNSVFDLDNLETAKLCFYIIRNIIRRDDRALDDDIRFMLDIPAVKALTHTAVTRNQENELLRLAINIGNTEVAELLLNIPAVRELAEQNDYYQEELRGVLDLRALAEDQESSMHALSMGEQQRLEAAIEKYQPKIKAAGVDNIIGELREMLLKRYRQNPSIININNKSTALPAEWEDFQKLKLQGPAHDHALEAYYRNKDHTAWRYLSKPNHWMNDG